MTLASRGGGAGAPAAATARALAAADAWDADAGLARAKVDARDAAGAELAAIPRELDDALALKRRLLRAADRRCAAARPAAAAVAHVANRPPKLPNKRGPPSAHHASGGEAVG